MKLSASNIKHKIQQPECTNKGIMTICLLPMGCLEFTRLRCLFKLLNFTSVRTKSSCSVGEACGGNTCLLFYLIPFQSLLANKWPGGFLCTASEYPVSPPPFAIQFISAKNPSFHSELARLTISLMNLAENAWLVNGLMVAGWWIASFLKPAI